MLAILEATLSSIPNTSGNSACASAGNVPEESISAAAVMTEVMACSTEAQAQKAATVSPDKVFLSIEMAAQNVQIRTDLALAVSTETWDATAAWTGATLARKLAAPCLPPASRVPTALSAQAEALMGALRLLQSLPVPPALHH